MGATVLLTAVCAVCAATSFAAERPTDALVGRSEAFLRPCTDKWTADPTARVFGDRLYLYTSHDLEGKTGHYEMTDWLAFSTADLRTWTDHGAFFSLDDIPWAKRQAWAPDVVAHGGRYYFFYPVERTKIGVAVSDNPVRGFRDIGHPLVDNAGRVEEIGPEPIDPSVIVVDGKGYLFFGCRQLRMVELDATLTNVVGEVRRPLIRGIEGRKEGDDGWYGEAPFVFRRGDWFYLMYSEGWSAKSTLVYARSKSVLGPWDYVGPIMPHQGCSTSHGSIVEFRGKWYIFYHDCRLSGRHGCRSVLFREIEFDDESATLRLAGPTVVEMRTGETLVGLRDRVRALPAEVRSNGVEVVIPPGTYPLREALALDERDSGVPGHPVVWRAEDPAHHPRVEGGIDLPRAKFRPVSDPQLLARLDASARGKVLEADLADFGFVTPIGPDVGHEVTGPLEVPDVFVNGRRLALAMFPSEGWCEIQEILDRGSRTAAPTAEAAPKPTGEPLRGGCFRYAEDRPGVWKGPVLLEGFWAYDWSASMIWTKEIDATAKTISLLNHHCYSVMKGTPRPRRWRALNVFEELNAPGRYVVDPVTKRLYLYPPREDFSAVSVCGARQPLVRFDGTCDVTFSGIDFGRSWQNGVELRGARRIVIEKAKFSEQRNQAIWAEAVMNCTFRTCDITRTGNAGISISAGDRRRLIPGDNVIEDCLFENWGFLKPYCGHAISMWGCGNHARHNLIRNANGYVIGWKQNNGVFAYNVVSNTTWGVDDAGAFYKGLNPSMRGNRLEYNYWRDIGAPGGHGSCAIYFDDGDSGERVYGNVFENCGKTGVHYTSFGAVFSHGGCSNLVENCIFVRCDRSLGGGPWKQELWEERIKGRNPVRWKNYDHKFKEEVDCRSPEWRKAYPELETFLDPYPEAIRKNAAYNNVAVDCPSVLRYPQQDGRVIERPSYVRGHWHTNETFVVIRGDPGFVDYANRDYRLKPDSEVYRRLPNFKPIPFEKIGLVHRR